MLLPVLSCNGNAASISSQSDVSETHILIPSGDSAQSTASEVAPDDIVGTPGGQTYRANVHQQGVADRWPSIETVEMELGSGADMVYLRYRNSIETNTVETRNNIFNIRKTTGRFDTGVSTINLYAVEIPSGVTLVQEGGAGLPGTIARILAIEIPSDMQPGRYLLTIGLEIESKDYGTVPCTVEVLK